MANNREILAKEITNRFISDISGATSNIIVDHNPNDKIFVGKLSPQSEANSISSSILIKQISVDFKVPRKDLEKIKIDIYPQGNFFYRILPTFEQQRHAFFDDFMSTFTECTFSSFDELIEKYNSKELSDDMVKHRVALLPVYKKIAIDRNNEFIQLSIGSIYNTEFECGSIPQESEFYETLNAQVLELCDEVKKDPDAMPCQFRDRIRVEDLISEDAWEKYKVKQLKREEFDMFPKFDYSISVDLKGIGDYIDITVALSNETSFGDESNGNKKAASQKDVYRVNTLFNSGILVKCHNTAFIPIELDYFADDYKYDKYVYAIGNNCNVEYDPIKMEIQTVHVPVFIQNRLKTNDSMAIRFDDLITNPVETLNMIYTKMLAELESWKRDFHSREGLTIHGKRQFESEIKQFELEIKRFKTGASLIERYNMVRLAFQYMNTAFKQSAKGYDSWRLFQIVFIVSLILDIVANEEELMLDDELKEKAKTDDIDILYFPTGGGKTEAFLGILVLNLFFDRLRSKEYGVTAILKYPLRLLSVQQVQRVSNILASAEKIRLEKGLGGDRFSLGYFVGEVNTPNKIDKELLKTLSVLGPDETDEKYRLLDVCPFCGKSTVHVVYDKESSTLRHICSDPECSSQGFIPLYMVDDDIYRYIPSVIISTVDKMTAIGLNMRFHNLLFGASRRCPQHGFTARTKCLVGNVNRILH